MHDQFIPAAGEAFAHDPVASHSAQFGLARPVGAPVGRDVPSPPGVWPWHLRAAQPVSGRGPDIAGWRYDHATQVAVTADGRPMVEVMAGAAIANSVSDLDGDEGRSEDWTYDFCPDSPGSPW